MQDTEKARQAIQRGDQVAARALLMPLARSDPANGEVWYLLAQILDDPGQKQDCLNRAVANGYKEPVVPASAPVKSDPTPIGLTPTQFTPTAMPTPETPRVMRTTDVHSTDSLRQQTAQPAAPVRVPKKRSTLPIILGIVLVLALAGGAGIIFLKPFQSVAQQQAAATEVKATATADAAAVCRDLAVAYGDEMKPIFDEWQDAVKLAHQTSRIQLAAQINNLQTVKRKTDAVKPPECAKLAHDYLVDSMDGTIDGFIGFLGQVSESIYLEQFEDAALDLEAYQSELLYATTGQPRPTPLPPLSTPGPEEVTGLESLIFQADDIPSGELSARNLESYIPGSIGFYARNIKNIYSGRGAGFIHLFVFANEQDAKAAFEAMAFDLTDRTRITDVGDSAYVSSITSGAEDAVFRRCFVVMRITMHDGVGSSLEYMTKYDNRIKDSYICK